MDMMAATYQMMMRRMYMELMKCAKVVEWINNVKRPQQNESVYSFCCGLLI